MKTIKKIIYVAVLIFCVQGTMAQGILPVSLRTSKLLPAKLLSSKVLYGTASFYADKFHGRQTANGEIFSQAKMTAACNVLPLGTWIRVTNLRNGRSVIVKVNDRLHKRMTRVVDMSKSAAKQLGYIGAGLTKVKIELLGRKKPV